MMRLDPRDTRQLRAWTESLGTTRREQINVIRDLLAPASGDQMAAIDRAFCVAALRWLAVERVQ